MQQLITPDMTLVDADDIHAYVMRLCARICAMVPESLLAVTWIAVAPQDEDLAIVVQIPTRLQVEGLRETSTLFLRVVHALDLPFPIGFRGSRNAAFPLPGSGHDRMLEARALEALFRLNGRDVPDGLLDGLDLNEPRPQSWKVPSPPGGCPQ